MELTDSTLREYLLGSSSPEAAEQIEARLLEDDELFAALQSAEDDLFDACARGRLAPSDRARFLERYAHRQDRLEFAGMLAQRTAVPQRVSPYARRPWNPLAAAAVLILAAGALVTRLEAPAPVVVRLQPPAAAAAPQPFVVALALGTSRAAGASTVVSIPSSAKSVQLNVRLDPGDRFDDYSMELRGANDRAVWSGAHVKGATVDGNLIVSAQIPATALPAGSYELAVRGAGTDLGFLPLTVRWSP